MVQRKDVRDVQRFIKDRAELKRLATEARFDRAPQGVEQPREVYLAACEAITRRLEPAGFAFVKSSPCARRSCGVFRFTIDFLSSRYNMSGTHVELKIRVAVSCGRLKKWRKHRTTARDGDLVASAHLGSLQDDPCWIEWDLADATERGNTIDDAVSAVERLALPYFARFEDDSTFHQLLLHKDTVEISDAVELLLCLGRPDLAKTAGSNFLLRHPQHAPPYRRRFLQYEEGSVDIDDLPYGAPKGEPEYLAFAAHAFELGDLTGL